jgi:hypothetical protein
VSNLATYSNEITRPLQQGDIFITSGVARIAHHSDSFAPRAWAAYDETESTLAESNHIMDALKFIGGRAAVMVLSHDCQLDKEINIAARALMKVDANLSEQAAFTKAEADDELDRFVIVSPLVDVDLVYAARDQNSLADILSARTVGYFPLPDEPTLSLEGVVVDLSYRTTVDRLTLTDRLVSLSDPARLRLRYALARMDSLRTPDLSSDLIEAVGQKIVDIQLPKKGRQTIELILDNGKRIEVLPKPGNTPQEGASRRSTPRKKKP